ncbi:MAG TPA: ATP-binding cassette domain-containing protein, partial [Solirubrobacteraceae bacterium]|nr:ATP-binding cassette domain-containing protein [Solirubrobacteraceae bacterium]
FERHWPRALSGGMRQRAALLRTFLAGRDVLLLDEPLGALDALTREEMREWLLEVWESDRKTILLVTHDVEEAVFLSDRVYVMSGRPGRIRAIVDVQLPRPRTPELTVTPEFVALEQQVRAPLRRARAGHA